MHISRQVSYQVSGIDMEQFGADASKVLKDYQEEVIEEMDEYIWTLEDADYRKGPGDSYKSAGTVEKDRFVNRTGITRNEWTRVLIDGNEYYIESDKLTEENPYSDIIYAGVKGEYQKYALSLFPDYGWSAAELAPLIRLWERESHWNPSAHNRSSGAHGIPQALPAGKMAAFGSDYYTNGYTQIRWGLSYINGRYGSPSNAWAHSQSRGWY